MFDWLVLNWFVDCSKTLKSYAPAILNSEKWKHIAFWHSTKVWLATTSRKQKVNEEEANVNCLSNIRCLLSCSEKFFFWYILHTKHHYNSKSDFLFQTVRSLSFILYFSNFSYRPQQFQEFIFRISTINIFQIFKKYTYAVKTMT